jgi:hypothetical protein
MRVHNLLLLPHLPTRCTKGKEPLIDYSQSHVVTNFEYLDILRIIFLEKADAKEMRTCKRNNKKDRQVKQVA